MKRAIFIFAVLVLAFSAIGAGFSSYSDSVAINSNCTTGTVAMGIVCLNAQADSSQLFPALQVGNAQQSDQTLLPTPTGTITAADGNWKGSIGGISYFDSQTVNAYNCQSGFSPGLQLEIANVGTLPARLSELSFDWGYLANSVTLCNWSLTSPDDGVLTEGTDVQSFQDALQQVVIQPQERLDLAVQMQFAGAVDEGVCAVNMQYGRWNVDTPLTGGNIPLSLGSVKIHNPKEFNLSTRLHGKAHPARSEKRGRNRRPGKLGNGRKYHSHGRAVAGRSTQ
jgi:hypothetical protein